jgi:LmbE family N-acetylglucosaminyl deacetylase
MYKILLFIFTCLVSSTCASASTSSSTQIVLSPHFDDASLPLGGMLAQSTNRKVVVTIFSGKPTKSKVTLWDTMSGFFSSNKAMDSRNKENESALSVLGALIINLGFIDYQYKENIDPAKKRESIKSEIVRVLDNESKEASASVYFPAFFGEKITHKDHALVHNITLDIIKSNTYPNIVWYMYEDLPYAMKFLRDNKISIKEYLETLYSDLVFNEVDIHLSDKELNQKLASIGSYSSQIRAFHFMGYTLKRVMNFTKQRCVHGACERVYEVKKKSF